MLNMAKIDQPGTPDSLVTELPFLTITLGSDLPSSGLTRWEKPRWHIYLNRTESPVRRRYSMAHEIKHILDHGMSEHLYPTTQWGTSDVRSERVCDYFAASLLMPKRLVKRRFFQGQNDPVELSAEFGVSPMAMRFRLDQLGLTGPTPRCDRQLKDQAPIDLSGYFRRAPLEGRAA
jgi:Zn-dependent peptidase ImmA (M78 family)